MAERKVAGVVILILAGLGGISLLACAGLVVGFYRSFQIAREEAAAIAAADDAATQAELDAMDAADAQRLARGPTPEETEAARKEFGLRFRAEQVTRLPGGSCKVILSGSPTAPTQVTALDLKKISIPGRGTCPLTPPEPPYRATIDLIAFTPVLGPEKQRVPLTIDYYFEGRRQDAHFQLELSETFEIEIPADPPKPSP